MPSSDLADLKDAQTFDCLKQAFAADCASFGAELSATVRQQRAVIEGRIAELEALRGALDELSQHIDHCCESCLTDTVAVDCEFCLIVTEEGGDAK